MAVVTDFPTVASDQIPDDTREVLRHAGLGPDEHRPLHSTLNGTSLKTRCVEYYRLWPGNGGDSGTWDTNFIDVPANTPDDKLDLAIREAIAKMEWRDELPVVVGCYNDGGGKGGRRVGR